MKKFLWLLLIPSLGYGAPCDTGELLQQIRPGAQWFMRGTVLTWLDLVQIEPTPAELQTALAACQQALTPAGVLSKQRSDALTYLDSPQAPSKAERALILVLIDELNILRGRDRDRSADVAAATTLADLKTRWAARNALADRDITQVKPAIQNKISTGASD